MNRRVISCSSSLSSLSALLNFAFIVVLGCTMLQAEAILLAPVYWNTSNPTFKLSRNRLTVQVNLYDGIDFVCPFYDNTTDIVSNSSSDLQYYVIYMVSEQSYDTCSLSGDITAILNCSTPRQLRRFTMFFEPFQAIPNAPEFHAGHSYYFITTSTGRKDGLMNADGGACYDHNMKLIVSVCCHLSIPTQSTSTVPTFTTSALSSSSLPSRSTSIGVSNDAALSTTLSSTHVKTSTTTSVVVIHADSTTNKQRNEMLSQTSPTDHATTTTTNRHLSQQTQSSLSCTCCASDCVFCFSLLQTLAFHYLLS